MKRIFTVLLLLVAFGGYAQSYNNEWIDYSKTYYKFKVGADGLYRIPQSALAALGFGNTPAQNFQLFRNGEEVPLYTSVASGPLGGSDYIEFWGRMNDGFPDQPLYRYPSYQHTRHYSLETDTAVYFLTVDNLGNTFHYINTTNDTTGNTLPVEPYLMYKSGSYFRDGGINPGFAEVIGEYIYSSSYDLGEFWGTPFIVPGSPYSNTKNNLYVYPGGPSATINFGMTGCADNLRNVQVSVNGTQVIDTAMNSFYDLLTSKPVPLSVISGNTATVQFTNSCANSTDRTVASFYELNYPRQFNFGGASDFYFELPARSNGYYLKITGFNVTGATPVLYDQTNSLRYNAIVGAGNVLSFLLGGSSISRRLVLVNEDPSTITTVSSFTQRNFTDYSQVANQGNYIIISHPLIYTGSSGNNPVADYKAYRNSAAGGSFNAQMYNVDDLVDEFAFGIKKDPISIQNFIRFARNVWSVKPQYVLLIGHGMTYSDYNYYSETAHDPLADRLNIVPTFGYPASDNKLSAGNPIDAVPITPIGRLSVVSGPELENYLQKLKEYESAQATAPNTVDGRLWMKSVLHLTGVSEPFLGSILCNDVTTYKNIITDTLCGDNVSVFCDGNASSVSQVPGDAVAALFNNGMGMLTYFGHSSNSALGYNLDDPSSYNNTGKYPMFYINGCDAGDFFVYDNQRLALSKTLSEGYVLAKEKGAIGFVASTHFGVVTYLDVLLYNLYHLMDGTDYGKTVGNLEKDALQALMNTFPGDFLARLHAEEMTTHGDPYLKLNQELLPDYDIEPSMVSINPTFIAVSNSNFTVNARYYNLGKAVSDSITVLVQRVYPDGSMTTLLQKRIPGIRYADSLSLVVPIVPTRDKGTNKIIVSLNTDNSVPEITMTNNSVTTSFVIYENEATPIYPYNYAIITTPTSKLDASTANPFSGAQQFTMELDTTQLFNSSALVTKNITQGGGVLEFDPGISYKDSTVYYWRVGVAPATPGGAYTWNGSSFIYIDSLHSGAGFNQSHYFQHQASAMTNMVLDSATRRFKFLNHFNSVYIRNTTYPMGSGGGTDDGYSSNVNGGEFDLGPGCAYNEIIFNVLDSVTFKPMLNDYSSGTGGLYNSMLSTCGANRLYNFEYSLGDPTSRTNAMNFLNMLPAGSFIEVRNNDNPDSASNTYPAQWKADTTIHGSGNSLYHIFHNAGVTTIDSFTSPRAFAFIYQKGVSSFTPQGAITNNIYDAIQFTVNCSTPDTAGSMLSPVFGPSKKWQKLHWRGSSLESPSADSVIVQVIGVDTAGNKTTLFNVDRTQQDFDISSVSAAQYPFIQLGLATMDNKKGTPYQLKYWRLEDIPVPEGALAPNIYLKSEDTLSQGEPLNFGIAFKNVSPYAFDSMRIMLNVIDRNNVTHTVPLPRRKPLISGDTILLNYTMDTKAYPGANTLYVFFNPGNDQPEQYLFNNFLYKTFYVRSDNRSPQLDVTFDNVHILNDDIVSAKPHIQIKLTSPSPYILMSDTSLLTVQVKFPDGSLHSYGFNSDTLRFTPSTGGANNAATVDFYPAFTNQINASGDDYELIVSGKDPLGNTAGVAPYRVGFKIITKAMISNMLNYPNPFTTSTAFVFTITGSDVPQNIKIQILTITGKIVREITKEELGPLHVGRNITEFKWDGTDMYGSRLANGVYLYHVVTNLNGKSLDKYTASGDNTDKFFNNGYGKMYLMK